MKRMLETFLVTVISFMVLSCGNKSNKEPEKQVEAADTTRFYPIGIFLGDDINRVIISQVKIYKTVMVDKQKADSVLIDTAEFRALANAFLEKDISNSPQKKFYKESIFRSLSTNSIVFNYQTTEPNVEVRSIDASLRENESEFYRLDIRASYQKNDSSFTESYCWLTREKFYTIKYAEGKDRKGTTTTTTVTWHK